MKVVITGGTGFVGTALVSTLVLRGHDVTVIDRNTRVHEPFSGVTYVQADLMSDRLKPEWFDGIDALVHLAGKSIFGTWTKAHKNALYASRIETAKRLIEAIHLLPVDRQPKAIVSANAVGYYGDRGDEVLTETSKPGDDFLAKLCVQWQDVWRPLEDHGVRCVFVRTAIVLDKSGGALQQLLPLTRWGLGTVIGSGKQWFSWVSLTDLVQIYVLAVEQSALKGPINAAAPTPLRNQTFTDQLAKALDKKHFLRVPEWMLKIAGKDISRTLLSSQRVKPVILDSLNYKYEQATIQQVVNAN